ncbi:MAG: ATP synthase F1 subunit gamma [Candidatus Anammoximicrobium sp.]|nr:ATP synthase F1 subunit gamma [Candidatus Anammoximicrobium sp.]
MANARKLDRSRKSIGNIRKITRTMELIATARFRKAMDRATAAARFTERISQLVADLARAGLEVKHPLLESREKTKNAVLLVLTANRGLCGGYNSGVLRLAFPQYERLRAAVPQLQLEVSGKRGISAFRFRKIAMAQAYQQFDDQPQFLDVAEIAARYLDAYALGQLDRLDVVYTKFLSVSRQVPVVETLLPLGSLVEQEDLETAADLVRVPPQYEFLPSVESILEEVVPASFKARLFKCFLDAGVSEQISRMVAMKSATENATGMIRRLSMAYNRARQSQITKEISEIIGGVEALKGD